MSLIMRLKMSHMPAVMKNYATRRYLNRYRKTSGPFSLSGTSLNHAPVIPYDSPAPTGPPRIYKAVARALSLSVNHLFAMIDWTLMKKGLQQLHRYAPIATNQKLSVKKQIALKAVPIRSMVVTKRRTPLVL